MAIVGFHLSPIPLPARVGPGFVVGLEHAATILRDLAERCPPGFIGERRAQDYKYAASLLADTAQQIVPVGEDVEGRDDEGCQEEGRCSAGQEPA